MPTNLASGNRLNGIPKRARPHAEPSPSCNKFGEGPTSARSAHYLFVIPTLDLVIVHCTDNDPPVRDAKTAAEIANRGSVSKDRAEFGHLLKMILDAQSGH
jgi:hypothetical protein